MVGGAALVSRSGHLGLGVIVGGVIGSPQLVDNLQQWWVTAVVVIIATGIATACGFHFGQGAPSSVAAGPVECCPRWSS